MPSLAPRKGTTPFAERLKRPLYYTVVELAVEVGGPNIMDYVIEAAEMRCSTYEKASILTPQTIKKLYP